MVLLEHNSTQKWNVEEYCVKKILILGMLIIIAYFCK